MPGTAPVSAEQAQSVGLTLDKHVIDRVLLPDLHSRRQAPTFDQSLTTLAPSP